MQRRTEGGGRCQRLKPEAVNPLKRYGESSACFGPQLNLIVAGRADGVGLVGPGARKVVKETQSFARLVAWDATRGTVAAQVLWAFFF